ncbi:hypothetical protein H0H92_014696, partial [Tricholoma furcatifolium]
NFNYAHWQKSTATAKANTNSEPPARSEKSTPKPPARSGKSTAKGIEDTPQTTQRTGSAPPSTTASLVNTPTPASQSTISDQLFWNPERSNAAQDSSSEDEDDDLTSSLPLLTPTTAERVRITRKNAVYDSVVGAMRGSKALNIPRMRPLREPIDDIARNTRRFNRIIADIIMR